MDVLVKDAAGGTGGQRRTEVGTQAQRRTNNALASGHVMSRYNVTRLSGINRVLPSLPPGGRTQFFPFPQVFCDLSANLSTIS